MQTTKPKVVRSYVTITDPVTRKSLALTVYGATPQQVKDALSKPGNKQPASAA